LAFIIYSHAEINKTEFSMTAQTAKTEKLDLRLSLQAKRVL